MVGGLLNLQLGHATVRAEILQLFKPFTLSCAMLVRIQNHAELPPVVVLKVYDRRFAAQLRRDERSGLWSREVEHRYHQFIQDGGAANFIAELECVDDEDDDDDDEGPDVRQDVVHHEAYLQHEMKKSSKTEMRAYGSLLQYQGTHIPKFYGSVRVHGSGSFNEYVDIQGILIEYISGFCLTELSTFCTKDQWQLVREDAIHIVHCLNSAGVLNRDVKLRNFLVHKDTEGRFKVVIIDLAICMFRHEFEDEEEWRELKQFFHEEKAVGMALWEKLEPHFVYRRSEYWKGLDEEFDPE